MSKLRSSQVVSFGGAVGAVALAATLTKACPGGCTSCGSCAAAILPLGATLSGAAVAFVGSAVARNGGPSRAKRKNGGVH